MKKKFLAMFTVIVVLTGVIPVLSVSGAWVDGFLIREGVLSSYSGTNAVVVVPDSVTEIASLAFNNHASIRTITIPESVKIIGSQPLSTLVNLVSVTFLSPEPPSVGVSLAYQCANLKEIYVPAGAKEAYEALNIFRHYSIIEGIAPTPGEPETVFVINSSGVLTAYSGPGGDIVIPEGVTSINNRVFFNNRTITSVVIPEGVTNIGEAAFRGCANLISVNLPNSLTTLGREAFQDTGLTSIVIPGSLERLSGSAFQSCRDLESVTIQDGVKVIGQYAFMSSGKLTKLVIPNSVTTIGDRFISGTGVKELVIPNSVTEFPNGATFSGASSLEKITLGSGLTSIPAEMFAGCRRLITLVIPDSVISIDRAAFHDCEVLATLIIPDGVTNIGERAFYNTALTEITIPSGVTEIGEGAFSDTMKLKIVRFESVKPPTLGAHVFSGYDRAVAGYVAEPTLDFPNVPSPTIIVPVGAKANYQAISQLNRLNIVEGESCNCDKCATAPNAGKLGHVLGNDTVGTSDALEILKYIVKLPGAISSCESSRKAATIMGDNITTADALEILKHIVKLPNKIDGTA